MTGNQTMAVSMDWQMEKVLPVSALLFFTHIAFWQTNVFADTDDLVLSVGVKEEYLDNIFFDPEDKVDDFLTTLSAGLEARKHTERLQAGLQGLLEGVVYVDNNDLNNLDQLYRGYAKYLVTERFSARGEASYKDDSRPDRDVAETGLILGTDVRKTQRFDGELGYDLSELSNVSFGYKYRKENYDENTNDDYYAHSASARWKYNLGSWIQGTTGRVTVDYSHYKYQFSETDNYKATLGLEKELTEVYSLYVDLGGRYSKYSFFNEDDINVDDDGTGGVLEAGLKYKGEYSRTKLSVLHDIAPASGRGRTMERTSFVGSWRYRLTEKLSSVINGGYYWNRGDVSFDPFDQKTIRIVPHLIYNLTNTMKLDAAYTYTNIDSINDNADKDRNDVFIRFVFNQIFFD